MTAYRPFIITIACCITAIVCQLIHEQHEDERMHNLTHRFELSMMGLGYSIDNLKSP